MNRAELLQLCSFALGSLPCYSATERVIRKPELSIKELSLRKSDQSEKYFFLVHVQYLWTRTFVSGQLPLEVTFASIVPSKSFGSILLVCDTRRRHCAGSRS